MRKALSNASFFVSEMSFCMQIKTFPGERMWNRKGTGKESAAFMIVRVASKKMKSQKNKKENKSCISIV